MGRSRTNDVHAGLMSLNFVDYDFWVTIIVRLSDDSMMIVLEGVLGGC